MPVKFRKDVDSAVQKLSASQLSDEEGVEFQPTDAPDKAECDAGKHLKNSKSGELSTIMNIMATIMGIAILGLPYTYKSLGIIPGAIMLIIMMCAHQFVCSILLRVKNLTEHANYTTMGISAVNGEWIKYVIKITMVL